MFDCNFLVHSFDNFFLEISEILSANKQVIHPNIYAVKIMNKPERCLFTEEENFFIWA